MKIFVNYKGVGALLVIIATGLVAAVMLKNSGNRWANAKCCASELNKLFPLNTHYKSIEHWLRQQKHASWSGYYFDGNTMRGRVTARISNRVGSPKYFDDAMDIVFNFDDIGLLIDTNISEAGKVPLH